MAVAGHAPAAAAAQRPAVARLGPGTSTGLVLAVALLFGVSGGMLWLVGYNYDGLSGGALTKIHPGTYLIVLLFGWSLAASGDPVARFARLAALRPASLVLAITALVALAIFVIRQAPGMAGLLDTFFGPALLLMLLADADERTMARMETALHVVMTANALLGLYEFASQNLLFPYRFEGAAFEWDPRSTSLQGHPLANAMMTACYLMALTSGARALPDRVRLALILLQSAALVVFGGRTALLLSLGFGGLYAISALLRQLKTGRVPLLGAALGVSMLAVLPVGLAALWAGGFFDALLQRFMSDGGSANARKEMFELVLALPLRDLVVGPDVEWVESLRRIHGLEWGIENPFVRMLVYQGLLVTLLLAVTFSLYVYELARLCRPGVWLPMIVWIILLNAAETVASKTTMPAKFSIIVLCLYRSPPGPRINPAAWSARAR
ncbi:MAG: VpsF family polysaccharide biosynthesis protein [Bosea sp. (in: a-proteobacteria)]